MSLPLTTTIAPSEEIVFRQIDAEAVLLNLTSGRYFGLNAVATRAWTLLVAGRSLGEIHTQLLTELEVRSDVLEADLDRWLSELLTKGLVTRQ